MKLISKSKVLHLNEPKIMAIINVTPDSFSDGGKYNTLDKALFQAEKVLNEGASILDIGGESTRPQASDVLESQELHRVIPVIEALRSRFDCWISIDTSKAKVMQEAVAAGADLINDVRALQEKGSLDAALKAQVPVCLMHMQGLPRTMQIAPNYNDLLKEIDDFFIEKIELCEKQGIAKNQLILDPGFGFGKNLNHNYQLLDSLNVFHRHALPILVGMSRKSMIFNVLKTTPKEALAGSLACATIAAMKGAHIFRVHDVKETSDILKIVNQFKMVAKLSGDNNDKT